MDRLVVVGAGAVGGSIAAMVADSEFPVTLVVKEAYFDQYSTQGLTVLFPDRQIRAMPEVAGGIAGVNWKSGDVVIVATKLNDAQAVMDDLINAAGTELPVVCASNGVAGETWARERFHQVLGMMIWMPSTHMSPGDFRVYGRDCPGVLDVGPICGPEHSAASTLASVLSTAGFDSANRHDIMRWKHAKWITNLGNTAQALITDDWTRIAKLAQQEGEAVFDAAKIDRVATDDFLHRCRYVQLAPINEEKRAGGSTWQSFERGRPLETPWIEGAVVELARSIGMVAPVNEQLTRLAQQATRTTASELLREFC